MQEAKAHLSEVIDESIRRGPQTVTRHGRPVALVVLPWHEFLERLWSDAFVR